MSDYKLTEYKRLVVDHILRPYQSSIPAMDTGRPVNFSELAYSLLPEWLQDNQWRGMVFNRLAEIDPVIEARIFPISRATTSLLYWMHEYEIRVVYN